MTRWRFAHWAASPEHPTGLLWGAPVDQFDKAVRGIVADFGEPATCNEVEMSPGEHSKGHAGRRASA
jgi:hypothetical protein